MNILWNDNLGDQCVRGALETECQQEGHKYTKDELVRHQVFHGKIPVIFPSYRTHVIIFVFLEKM